MRDESASCAAAAHADSREQRRKLNARIMQTGEWLPNLSGRAF